MLSKQETLARIASLDGPGDADPDLREAIKEYDLAKLVTVVGYHYILGFEKQKHGFLGLGGADLRAWGITKDGRPFFMRTVGGRCEYSGFVGRKLFARVPVTPPGPGYDYIEVALIGAVDEIVAQVDGDPNDSNRLEE